MYNVEEDVKLLLNDHFVKVPCQIHPLTQHPTLSFSHSLPPHTLPHTHTHTTPYTHTLYHTHTHSTPYTHTLYPPPPYTTLILQPT